MENHPYFVYPLLEALKTETDPQRLLKIQEKIAVNVGSEEALRKIFDSHWESFSSFYPDLQASTPSTDDTIDSFIDKFGNGNLSPDAPLLPVDAPSDYFASLEEKPQQPEEEPMQKPAEKSAGNLTLELAKIMIKNGNYEKAIEIIRGIYLNNPEKSIYFADQIRYIKKMMLNEQKKKSKI